MRLVDVDDLLDRAGRAENTATRSARKVASPRLWVTKTMVLSVRDSSTERSSPRIIRVCSSSAPNGSSIEQNAGLEAERAGQGRALAHAAGELAGIVLREILEPDGFERAVRARLAFSARHALEHHAEVDVLEHRIPWEQRVLLEHKGDVARHRPRDLLVEDLHRARGWRHQSADDVEQVDLPQPLGPIRQSNSPRVMSSEVSRSARTWRASLSSPK